MRVLLLTIPQINSIEAYINENERTNYFGENANASTNINGQMLVNLDKLISNFPGIENTEPVATLIANHATEYSNVTFLNYY